MCILYVWRLLYESVLSLLRAKFVSIYFYFLILFFSWNDFFPLFIWKFFIELGFAYLFSFVIVFVHFGMFVSNHDTFRIHLYETHRFFLRDIDGKRVLINRSL